MLVAPALWSSCPLEIVVHWNPYKLSSGLSVSLCRKEEAWSNTTSGKVVTGYQVFSVVGFSKSLAVAFVSLMAEKMTRSGLKSMALLQSCDAKPEASADAQSKL